MQLQITLNRGLTRLDSLNINIPVPHRPGHWPQRTQNSSAESLVHALQQCKYYRLLQFQHRNDTRVMKLTNFGNLAFLLHHRLCRMYQVDG